MRGTRWSQPPPAITGNATRLHAIHPTAGCAAALFPSEADHEACAPRPPGNVRLTPLGCREKPRNFAVKWGRSSPYRGRHDEREGGAGRAD
eukprot:gene10815-18259_t